MFPISRLRPMAKAALAAIGPWLAACGTSSAPEVGTADPVTPVPIDRHCDEAAFPSAEWTLCETANFAKQSEALIEQLGNPALQARWLEQQAFNLREWTGRALADPSWLDPRSGNTIATPVSATWDGPYSGDPFRYPQADGPDGAAFYENEAQVIPVVFYDRDCARLSGRVWLPRNGESKLPNVVFISGSLQSTETLYWPASQALIRAGYAVLTFDVRGQGRSDFIAPDGSPGVGQLGSNANIRVFWEGGVDAVDFFRSTPTRPYPRNVTCEGTYPTAVTPFNPGWDRLDPDRLGLAGQSAGAVAATIIQGYDAPGAEPWPGQMDARNPVKAIVAWDSLTGPGGMGFTPTDNVYLPPEVGALTLQLDGMPAAHVFGPRVPAMSNNADYHLLYDTPYPAPPDPERHKLATALWQTAGIPVFGFTIAGTFHTDQGMGPNLPATSNCPDTSSGACRGGWGLPSLLYYTVAWFDRWLKAPGEPGYDDADARLLDDGGLEGAVKMSWHFRSMRDFPDRKGRRQHCEDIRAGC